MKYRAMLVLCLFVSGIHTAPLQLRLMHPNVMHPLETVIQQQGSLEQQFIAFQQLQALQKMNAMQKTLLTNPQRPLLILLPDAQDLTNDRVDKLGEKYEPKHSTGFEDESSESVIVDAEEDVQMNPKKGLLVLPNGRFSIGGFIGLIPFLPFEINVPDSISWIYNGISGIISGIGQRLPFRPQNTNTNMPEQSSLRLGIEDSRKKTGLLPILMMPFDGTVLPVQVN